MWETCQPSPEHSRPHGLGPQNQDKMRSSLPRAKRCYLINIAFITLSENILVAKDPS